MEKTFLILLTAVFVLGCRENSKHKHSSYSSSQSGYEDGVYCAEVDYYNPNTGTNSTYTLAVEIEDNELTIIHWPNGGWLDSSHFSPPDISSGEASFTSDSDAEYTVNIIGEEGECDLDNYIEDDDNDDDDEQ